jgi:hypothetical protein
MVQLSLPPLTLTLIEPEGVPAPGATTTTDAVAVTTWPDANGPVPRLTLVVVFAFATGCVCDIGAAL